MGHVDYHVSPPAPEVLLVGPALLPAQRERLPVTYSHPQGASFDPFAMLRLLILNVLPTYRHRCVWSSSTLCLGKDAWQSFSVGGNVCSGKSIDRCL